MFYEEVFRKLAEERTKYAVAGGVALVLHGVVPLTADLDLIVGMSSENLKRFLAVMDELGYKPKQPFRATDFLDPSKRKTWKDEKGMEVFSFYHPQKQMNLIDVSMEEPISFKEIEKEIGLFRTRDIEIPVVSRRHLKIIKMLARRPQYLADIEALEELDRLGQKDE